MMSISVKHLAKTYGDKIIFSDVSFDVHAKECVALIGPSGSGKSTILNMIGLLEPVDMGDIYIEGKRLPKVQSKAAVHYRRHIINYLFQTNALISNETVYYNLMLALTYTKLSPQEKKQKIEKILSDLNLSTVLQQPVNELSGGEQQRIAVARAILKPGNIILADEPTGSLDPQMAQRTFELLHMLRNRYEKTLLFVTHSMEQANQGDRIIQLDVLKSASH